MHIYFNQNKLETLYKSEIISTIQTLVNLKLNRFKNKSSIQEKSTFLSYSKLGGFFFLLNIYH